MICIFCSILNIIIDKIIWSSYFLNIQDRKRYQEGTIIIIGVKWRYYGDLVDGKAEGTGQMSWEDGDFYSGEFKNDVRHGKGIAIWLDGTVHDGENENGKRNGMGVVFNIRKKWRYEGQYKDGKRNGSGIWHYEDGTFYIGGLENDKFQGFGTHLSADGRTVIKCGLWENDELKKPFWTKLDNSCSIKLIDWQKIFTVFVFELLKSQ